MRFVVEYCVGDGCSWSAEYCLPVEYESQEAFLVDLEAEVMKETKWPDDGRFKLAGHDFDRGYMKFKDHFGKMRMIDVDILTVDAWFERTYK